MKKTFSLLIIISSLALVGIIFTQVFWIMNAMDMKEDNFNNDVGISTKLIANQMFDYQVDISSGNFVSPCDTSLFDERPIIEVINPQVLDSLIKAEFSDLDPSSDYTYGVYHTQDTTFIILKDQQFRSELASSPYQINLTCLYRPDIYMLSMHFMNKRKMIMSSIFYWLFISILLMVALILGYVLIIFNHFRQKKLSEMKSDFINNMTHEFKTPLSTISLASEMMLRPDINEYSYKVKRYAKVVHSENDRLQHQVDHILQLAALERDTLKLRMKPVQVNRLINNQVEHFKMKLGTDKGQIRVNLDAEKDEITADRNHLTNVLSNLIDNALKYSKGVPEIIVGTRRHDEGIEITVKDNGIGISKEDQKLIFKKLYRVPTGDIHDVKGFGIGLFYVKSIVEAHGGRIRLISELGEGSTFSIFMPYNQNEN